MRTFRKLLPLVLGTALLGTACAGGGGPVERVDGVAPVRVGMASPTFNTTLINLALAADLDAAHGIDLQPTASGAGSNNQLAAMLSGEFDVAATGTLTAVNAAAEGAPVVIVAGTGTLINNVVLNSDVAAGLPVSADAPVEERIAALRGLRIATSPPGGTSNETFRNLVGQAGLDPERDLEIVPVNDTSALVAGVREGTYDGAFFGVGVGDVAVADGSATLWLSVPRGDVPEFDDLIGVSIISTQRFAAENPEIVADVQATLADAVQMVESNPDEAGRVLAEDVFTQLDPAVFDVAWEQARTGFPPGALFTQANWDRFVEIYQPYSDKDFSAISYDDLVVGPARGDT